MRNPGIAKEYFQLVMLGCQWTLEVRAFMAAVIARKLGVLPRQLPVMTDQELWRSYKTSVGVGDMDTLQETFMALPEYVRHLAQGEIIALMLGVLVDAPTLPQGETVGDLAKDASPEEPEEERTLLGGYSWAIANMFMEKIEHPSVIHWEERERRYPSNTL
jgi:hypothetical protein